MNNKNDGQNKGQVGAGQNDKNVILDKDMNKSESGKKTAADENEQDRHKHGKDDGCACKYF